MSASAAFEGITGRTASQGDHLQKSASAQTVLDLIHSPQWQREFGLDRRR